MKKYLISFLVLAMMCNIALAASLTADRATEVKKVVISPMSDINLSNVATPKPQVQKVYAEAAGLKLAAAGA